MIEQVFRYGTDAVKTIEQVVKEETLHLNHMLIPGGESFPRHVANATVYMTVMRGKLSIELEDQGLHEYQRGDVLKVPQGTAMQGFNHGDEMLELWIVKVFG